MLVHASSSSPRHFLTSLAAGLACVVAAATAGGAAEGELGQGAYRYHVLPGWGDVSAANIPLHDCHAMRMDSKGRIVLINNGGNNNVIIYDRASGKMLQTWGTTYPGVHGLQVVPGADGDHVWLTDHDRHQVIEATIDGKELRTFDWPEGHEPYTKKDQYKPTDIEFGDKGDFYVFDGYGQATVIHYAADGKILRIFGGKGDKPENLNTPHGGIIDRRDPAKPVLLVASRGQQAIKRFTLDGDYIDAIPMPGADVCDVFIFKGDLYVPNLNGYVSILDQTGKVVSNVAGSAPAYDPEGHLTKMSSTGDTFIHPHNLFVDPDGAIYVAQWNSKGTHPIKLERAK